MIADRFTADDALPSGAAGHARPARKALFISWLHFSRRIASLDEHFGFDVRYLPSPVLSKWLKPFGYVKQALGMAHAIATTRPDEVWLHCPPTFLPHLALIMKPLGGGYRIVADGHSGAWSRRWDWLPGRIWAFNRCDVVLAHNAEDRDAAIRDGVDPAKLVLLEDPPPLRLAPARAAAAAPGAPYVLVPCSFNPDEPIETLLAAARLVPELRFLVTGSRRRAEFNGFTRDVPENVAFTDYLPLDEFERLLVEADVVLGITSMEGIQLSVANEALGVDKALVLSDTRVLRAMFGAAALMARNTPEDLAARLREAMARRAELEARSAALKTRRLEEWRAPAQAVAKMLA